MSEDDPATGRRFLTGSAYADDRRIREPTLAWIGEPLDFDAVLDNIATRVEQVIHARGSFRATSHMGVFICR